jgi:hypothetical protein
MLARFGNYAVMAAGSASLLLAGESKAALYNACQTAGSDNPFQILFKDLVTGDQFQCQDKLFTIGDPASLKATNSPSSPNGGSLKFEWSAIPPESFPYDNDLFSLSIDFVPNLIGPRTGSFEYTIAADVAAGYTLKDVSLDSVVDFDPLTARATTVTKDVYDSDTGLFIAQLKSVDGSPNLIPKVPLNGASTVRVVDSWSVAPGDTLDNIQNGFRQDFTQEPPSDVPGPLPLLGAGAAFGFSRRLRSRLLAAKRV